MAIPIPSRNTEILVVNETKEVRELLYAREGRPGPGFYEYMQSIGYTGTQAQLNQVMLALVNGTQPGPDPLPELTAPAITVTQITHNSITATTTDPDNLGNFVWYLDGVEVDTGTQMEYTYTGVTPETQYSLTNAAYDAENDRLSPISAPIMVTTLAEPVEPEIAIKTVAILGQSEIEHIFNDGSFYRQIVSPELTGGEMPTILEKSAPGHTTTTPYVVTINEQTKEANNPSLVAIANILSKLLPNTQINLVDFAVSGTSLHALVDDSNDNRYWSVLEQVKNFADQEFGGIDVVLQNWWNATRANMKTFGASYAPALIGERWNGEPYELGTPVIDSVVEYTADHCFWDVSGQDRGLFGNNTKYSLMGFGPAFSAPDDVQATSYASSGTFSSQLDKPARQAMEDFVNDPRLAPFSAGYGVSSHICKFGDMGAPSGSTAIHQSVLDPDGQILFAQHTAVAIAQALGANIYEPEVIGIEPEGTGAYADLIISLPNGGDLTTIRKLRSEAQPDPLPPHWNEAIGFEINGSPFDFTAEIIDSGSGLPRAGRVRITPNNGTLLNGTNIEYLRGSSTAALLRPRDEEAEVYKDMLLEHIPSLAQGETYPYAGIPVKPHCDTQVVSGVVEPEQPDEPYEMDLVDYTDGFLGSNSLSAPSAGSGLMSAWFRNDAEQWVADQGRFVQVRIGTTIVFEINKTSNGRLVIRFNTSGANTIAIYASPEELEFEPGQLYHILMGWTSTTATVLVNRQKVAETTFDSNEMNGTISRFSVGAQTTGSSSWTGAIGQIYFNVQQTLDLNNPENVSKFISESGQPVNLGSNGQIPTGLAPAFFVDAPFDQVSNLGNGGVLTVTGTLADGAGD